MPASLRELLDAVAPEPGEAPEPEELTGGGLNFSDVLDAGEGALFGALDALDRPGRAVRHLLTGNVRQALEAFDPFNLFTEEESQPISGREVLGLPDEEGLDSADVAGFGAEIALDPLTYLGGFLGRFAAKMLGKGGQLTTGLLEGAAKTPGSLQAGSRSFRLGEMLAGSAGARAGLGALGGGLL